MTTRSPDYQRVSYDTPGSPWEPTHIKGPKTKVPGLHVKFSRRCYPEIDQDCLVSLDIPYIDVAGKPSQCVLARWRCSPWQRLSTLVATAYSRLSRLLFKRFGGKARKLRNLCFKAVSLAYATNQFNVIDRFLGTVKSSEALAGRVLRKFERKLDDSKRFVYSQVLLRQTHWLTSRSERPRDKSSAKQGDLLARRVLKLYGRGDPHCGWDGCSCWVTPTTLLPLARHGSTELDEFW